MSGPLTERQQLAAIEETTPGTVNTGVYAAAQAKHLLIDCAFVPDFPGYDRNIKRSTLTPLPPLTGQQNARVTFSLELAGEAASGTPPYDIFLRACGMRRETLEKITIGAVTGGPFRHGETITQTTSGATAKVFFDTDTGTTTMYVYDIVGTEDGTNVWTGALTGATATPSTGGSAAGLGWRPVDFDTVTVTYSGADPAAGEFVTGATSGAIGVIESINTTTGVAKIRIYNAKIYSNGETLTASTTGAIGTASNIAQEDMPTLTLAVYEDGNRFTAAGSRGNVTFNARVGEPCIMAFEFTGAFADQTDAAMLTGVTFPLKVPPTMLSASALLGTEGSTPSYAARFSAVSLNLGNEIQYRVDASAATGVRETMIVDRAGTGSIDPEADLESSYAWVANFKNNAIGSLAYSIGSTAGNRFRFQVPGLKTQSFGTGDRAKVRTRDIGFALTGGSMANVSSSPNERCDLLLAYLI